MKSKYNPIDDFDILPYFICRRQEVREMLATLTSKGQITLPKSYRDRLDLKAGDKMDFVLLDNGVLQIVPLKQSPQKLKGIVPKRDQPVSIDEMNQAIKDGAANK